MTSGLVKCLEVLGQFTKLTFTQFQLCALSTIVLLTAAVGWGHQHQTGRPLDKDTRLVTRQLRRWKAVLLMAWRNAYLICVYADLYSRSCMTSSWVVWVPRKVLDSASLGNGIKLCGSRHLWSTFEVYTVLCIMEAIAMSRCWALFWSRSGRPRQLFSESVAGLQSIAQEPHISSKVGSNRVLNKVAKGKSRLCHWACRKATIGQNVVREGKSLYYSYVVFILLSVQENKQQIVSAIWQPNVMMNL